MFPETAYGLCAGRHQIPVRGYIFNEVKDVLDFTALNNVAFDFVQANCNIRTHFGAGIAQVDYTDVEQAIGDHLDVVVTGLTACTTAVMWACACNGVPLALWHYDRETGDYVPQHFRF